MPLSPKDLTQAMPAYDEEFLDAARPTAKPPRGIGVSGDSRREPSNSPFPPPPAGVTGHEPRIEPARKASGELEAVREFTRASVRESVAPKEAWAEALEQHAQELRRVSAANLDQFRVVNEEIDEHEERLKRIESNATDAAVSSSAVQKLLTGFLPPKVVLGLVALWSGIQAVIQLVQALRGH